jgi:hypothetical protein
MKGKFSPTENKVRKADGTMDKVDREKIRHCILRFVRKLQIWF